MGVNNGTQKAEISCQLLGCEETADLLSGEKIRESIFLDAMEGKAFRL